MNKERLRYLPLNLIMSAPFFLSTFMVIYYIGEVGELKSVLLTSCIYIYDVVLNNRLDYIESKLENKTETTKK